MPRRQPSPVASPTTWFARLVLSIAALAAASAHSQPAAAPGKTRAQVLDELIAAQRAGQVRRGNAEPPAQAESGGIVRRAPAAPARPASTAVH
ncbi:DUF4148 domain-containing protein [Bordetella bronchiseptica]|uniref:DUF4148 domain-containing protein n=1 Tax=Bordetella genomosp. 6 TaxID=463024 RepID=A0ABX4FAQ6_9BORD|nr:MULTISPECIES: DUF4148 domain-containing protein [Bordetella]OZI75419.1 hypothetical protein CAL23_15950 [Bordetella genomosp. 6]